ncbi:alpha-2-HS-glycoprotein [Gracilinanus agilis]|uniref:alpha-2-HS-glycoprotein n=1 Tax=Gracilinanus agilis TaxID=191870 RepID=UPI001CFE1699|nr:alpha-2-HS-glycoprotein [Gracilinanus agilis]
MRSVVAFICLAQLLSSATARFHPLLPVRDPNCDDPDVEQAAHEIVRYVNDQHHSGYKYRLNQIDKARVYPRRPSGEVYVMEVDMLETTCHVMDRTPLENCTVRQLVEHAVEGDCEASVLKMDGLYTVLNAKCESNPDSAEDVRKVCPDCFLLAPLNNTKVVHAVEASMAAFISQNQTTHYKLLEVSRAQISPLQTSISVEFVIAPTDCGPGGADDPSSCNPLADQYGFCKGTLTEKAGVEDVSVICKFSEPVVPAPQPTPVAAGPDVAVAAKPAIAIVSGPGPVRPAGPVLTHLPHHDLRHSFVGVASLESASGERGAPVGPAPAVPGPGPAAPAIPLCPGRIRHFKV